MSAVLAVALAAAFMQTAPESAPAQSCALCHARIGAVGQYPLWRGSMKSHAAIDPFWKAQVAYEKSLAPEKAADIDTKCLRCHAPARELAAEGVTCTVCHQIGAEGLGERASFSGGFRLNNRNEIYGPHAEPFFMPMLRHTGYTATESRHVMEAALCSTCHTLITGEPGKPFYEQAPYLEWLASAYAVEKRPCQSCHVPPLGAAEYIAHRPPGGPFPPTGPREPFGRHLFAGGNTAVPVLLARLYPERAAAVEEMARRAREMLSRAAAISGNARLEDGRLKVRLAVENLAGHKLPTAYPARRLWLHVRVTEGAEVVFESGRWDAGAGEVAGMRGSQPHRGRIDGPGQVMIYEAEMGDAAGRPTGSLLAAASYLKDNRILPRGFDARRAEGVAPVGTAADVGFRPGSHAVEYDIGTGGRKGPFRVAVEALYQSIKPAAAKALAPEFVELHRAASPAPVPIARAAFTAAE